MAETEAWIWVIEAMASFSQVSLSLLHDLVEAAPELPAGSMKSAKERLALRCLEQLFARQTSSVPGSKVGLDVSESCENVLKRIVQEGSMSELKTVDSELAKLDIEPFIRHKRANMPELELVKLSHSIRDGTHPYSDFLRQSYGLGPTNLETGACTNTKDLRSTTSVPNLACSDAKKARDKAISTAEIVKKGEKRFEDNLNGGDVLPTKRSGNSSASKDYHDAQNDNVNKAKQCASSVDPVLEPNLVSASESEPREDFTDAQNDKSKLCPSSTNTVLELNPIFVSGREQQEDFSDQGVDDCTASQKSRENDDEELHGSDQIPAALDGPKVVNENLEEPCGSPSFDSVLKNSFEEARGKSDDKFQFQSPKSVEHEEKAKDCGESETASDSHGYRNERIDVVNKKHVVLSSKLVESLDPGMADSSEKNPGMKCSGSNCQGRKEEVHHNTLRRKKVPWTTEEEEMIKKCMQQSSGERFQWKMMLESGKSTFLKGRTAVDLKDKWRNMCKGKGSPKPELK